MTCRGGAIPRLAQIVKKVNNQHADNCHSCRRSGTMWIGRVFRIASMGLMASGLLVLSGDAQTPAQSKITLSLDSLAPDALDGRSFQHDGEARIVVILKAANRGRSGLQSRLELPASLTGQAFGLSVTRTFQIGNNTIFVVNLPPSRIATFKLAISRAEGIHAVEPDARRKKAEMNDPHFSTKGLWGQSFDNQWAIKQVGYTDGKKSAWAKAGTNLRPVTVAVIDTGLDWYHPDLPRELLWQNTKEIADNKIDDDGNGYVDDVIGWNFIDSDAKPWDYDGHGTFVAGIVAAGQNNGIGISGINPAARIMVLRALDAFGQGHASMVAEAIAYAADNGARVINLSLGGRGLTKIEQLAVDHARSKGAILVVAAGNDASAVAGYSPAGLKGVITVTATDRRDRRAGFSNWGPLIDIAAPGVDVLSLRARKTDLLAYIRGVKYEIGKGIVGKDRAYYRASGTSFAVPIVSGTLSLILSKSPQLSADEIRRMVLNSARDIETSGIDNYTGYGLLDATAALGADPDFFVESRIAGVKVVQEAGITALRVLGTSNASQFAKASVFLGKGKQAKKWFKVDYQIKKPVKNGTLIYMPAGLFKGEKQWTIRLVTEHKDGSKRESRFELTLGG